MISLKQPEAAFGSRPSVQPDSRQVGGLSTTWEIWAGLRRSPAGVIGLLVVIVHLLIALSAPVIAPYDPVAFDTKALRVAPSLTHLFGTDKLGRDIFSRTVWGGRTALAVTVVGTALAVTWGGLLGITLGYVGGIWDEIGLRLVDALLALPRLLVLLLVVSILGSDTGVLIGMLGFLYGVAVVRMARCHLRVCGPGFCTSRLCHGRAATHHHYARTAAQCAGFATRGGRAALVMDALIVQRPLLSWLWHRPANAGLGLDDCRWPRIIGLSPLDLFFSDCGDQYIDYRGQPIGRRPGQSDWAGSPGWGGWVKFSSKDPNDLPALGFQTLGHGSTGHWVGRPCFGRDVGKAEEQARQMTDILLQFTHIDLVGGVARLVVKIGIGPAPDKAPAPQVGSVQPGAQKGKMIRRRVQLRHDMTLEAVTHVV